MTFAVLDASIDDGSPFFLYQFTQGATTYRYSSIESDVTYASDIYSKTTISHDEVVQGSTIERLTLSVQFPRSHPLADVFLSSDLSVEPVNLTILRCHEDPDTNGVEVAYKGRFVSLTVNGQTLDTRFENLHSTMKRNGLRARYQKNCRHILYGNGCGVDIATYSTAASVTATGSSSVTVDTLGSSEADYYYGGLLVWNSQNLLITSQSGSVLTLKYRPAGLVTGQSVSIAPGCPLNITTCNSRFNNALNFGGFPYTPKENPVEGFSGLSLL